MKILVTGGKGFIGSKIVERLCKDNDVIVMDNRDTYGLMSSEQLKNLYKWRERNWQNVTDINGDILDRLDCLKAFTHGVDMVIHLATYPRAKLVEDDPIAGVPKIIDGTVNLLWHAQNFGCKKFVYVSSSMVYGNFTDGTKEDGHTKPINIYGEAKLAGERITKLFSRRHGLNYNIVRPSGVYGPGDMPDRVVSKFFKEAMQDKTITLHDGNNKVDLTYRQDAADGIIKAAFSEVSNTSFNITTGNATSLRTLAETIIEMTGSKSDLKDI